MGHPKVPHPREILAGEGRVMRKFNDLAAFKLAAFYGAAITIWLFALYSVMGAVFPAEQVTMLYWSNAAQLVFCPLMVYVGNKLDKAQKAKEDADHLALTHLAQTADESNQLLKQLANPKEEGIK